MVMDGLRDSSPVFFLGTPQNRPNRRSHVMIGPRRSATLREPMTMSVQLDSPFLVRDALCGQVS